MYHDFSGFVGCSGDGCLGSSTTVLICCCY